MINYTICYSALQLIRNSLQSYSTTVVELSILLCFLLLVDMNKIMPIVTEIVNNTVDLKKALIEEKELYHVF